MGKSNLDWEPDVKVFCRGHDFNPLLTSMQSQFTLGCLHQLFALGGNASFSMNGKFYSRENNRVVGP